MENTYRTDQSRYPEGTATQAVKIVAVHGVGSANANPDASAGAEDGTSPVEGGDPEEAMREALAWIALHARAAATAEKELAVELAKRDTKARKKGNR